MYLTGMWVEKHGEEKKLPGLEFSPRQLFWLSYARTTCTKYSFDELHKHQAASGFIRRHSLSDLRLTGVVQNRPEFARDFNCVSGATMNPVKKCEVW